MRSGGPRFDSGEFAEDGACGSLRILRPITPRERVRGNIINEVRH